MQGQGTVLPLKILFSEVRPNSMLLFLSIHLFLVSPTLVV